MRGHCIFKNCKCQHIKINKYTKLCTCNHAKCWHIKTEILHIKAELFSPLSKAEILHIKAELFSQLSKTEILHIKAELFSPLSKKYESSQFLSTRNFARTPNYIFIIPPPIEEIVEEPNYCNSFENLPA